MTLDAPQRPDRDVALGMRNRDAAVLRRMLELYVAALLRDPIPSIAFERPDDLSAVHDV
jgi:hypothetical protein